jgi:hypothetical protein
MFKTVFELLHFYCKRGANNCFPLLTTKILNIFFFIQVQDLFSLMFKICHGDNHFGIFRDMMLKELHTVFPVGPVTALSIKPVSGRMFLSSHICFASVMKTHAASFSKIMEICLISLIIKEMTLK